MPQLFKKVLIANRGEIATRVIRACKELDIPTVAIYSEESIKDVDEAIAFAEKIGYPIMVKASGGGGGRGLRVARNEKDLVEAITTARKESAAAFGVSEVFLEKYLDRPHHIEFQIFADKFGNTVHLGERDCSIQRRHQKLIEITPSLILNEDLRKRMGEAAVKAAKAANYTNAGTVEFLVDADRNFYFLEMNTRIQVEHPITEEVTGIDLVKKQIEIAAGMPLGFKQEDVK